MVVASALLPLGYAQAHDAGVVLDSQGNPVRTGFGETETVARNDTPRGRAQNRRVELRILVK